MKKEEPKKLTKDQEKIIELCAETDLSPGKCTKCKRKAPIRVEGECKSCILKGTNMLHAPHCNKGTCKCYPGIVAAKGWKDVQ